MTWDETKKNAPDPENPAADEQLTATEWNNHTADQKTRSKVFSAAGAPSVTPEKVGDLYLNSSNSDLYYADGLTSSDWVLVATAGDLSGFITASSTDTLTNKSGSNSQWSNDEGYITGYTVTEADVTQYEAALSITESQISDLGVYALDNVVVKLTGDQSITGSKTFSDRALLPFVNSGNLGATPTLSFASTQAYRGTLDANTTITVSNVADGQRASIHLYHDATAQRTIAWSGIDLWLEGEAPTAPDTDEVLVVTLLNDGVNVIGSFNIARSVA